MKVEKIREDFRYLLTNEDLEVGDEVFPIAFGRCTKDGTFLLHDLDYSLSSSGFPDFPHIIEDLKHSDYKPYDIRTDHGYGPIEKYYKIVDKVEKCYRS